MNSREFILIDQLAQRTKSIHSFYTPSKNFSCVFSGQAKSLTYDAINIYVKDSDTRKRYLIATSEFVYYDSVTLLYHFEFKPVFPIVYPCRNQHHQIELITEDVFASTYDLYGTLTVLANNDY